MHALRGRWRAIVLALSALAMATSAFAQDASAPPPPHALTIDALGTLPTPPAPLFTDHDRWAVGAIVLGTIAMAPLDRSIANKFQEPGAQASTTTRRAANFFNTAGGAGTVVASAALYGIGRLAGSDHVAALGIHAAEAIVASAAVANVIKIAAGRQRPFQAGKTDADDFSFGRGLKEGYSSFPSGHATAAFATATVVTLETSEWWPRSTPFVAPAMFGAATLVGMARLYSNAHWASDVVMGAGIGTLTGFKVVRFNREGRTRLDRFLLGAIPSVGPDPAGGTRLAWSIGADR